MINLIPPTARRTVVKEYWLRVATVWLFLIAFAFFVVGVLKTPAYLLISSRGDLYSAQVNQAVSELEASVADEALIKEANEKAAHLRAAIDTATTPFSVVIDELTILAGAQVTIEQFNLIKTAEGLGEIQISGTASERADLTRFDDAIEAHPLFEKAVLPISNLAQDRNLSYQITITPAGAKQK